MSAPNQNTKDEILRLFRAKKVEISFAIKNLFPFLHGLRDKKIISEEEFKKCCDKVNSDRNIICKAIYDVLETIELSVPAVSEMFCKVNLKAYPDLQPIYQSLESVVQHAESIAAPESRNNKVPKTQESKATSSTGKQRKRKRNQKKQNLDFQDSMLPVQCGTANGVLHKGMLKKGVSEKCIKGADGNWFTPSEFEAEGGRERSKCWRKSIRCEGVPLEQLIARGDVPKPPRNSPRKKKDASQRLQKNKVTASSTPRQAQLVIDNGILRLQSRSRFLNLTDNLGRTPPTPHSRPFQRENPSRPFCHSTQFQSSGMAKTDLFSSPEIPVQCGAVTGVLHVDRFAAALHKKSIRMKERWCTPEEFVGMDDDIIFKSWDNDIRASGVPLRELIEDGSLKIHSENCSCETCKEDKWPENDDTCAVCMGGGYLLCCDSCPRSFHNSCHIPLVSVGESKKWVCTFCKLKSKEDCAAKGPFRQERQVLKYKMLPGQTLKCQFLLLTIWCEIESIIFADDPTTQIQNYDHYIKKPMWLKRVTEKLYQQQYERVGDFIKDLRLMFKNFQSFNQGVEIAGDGKNLQDIFEKTFQEVFSLSNCVVLEA
ncbi:nuclear body protein SP140-like [Elgaria multicarinata webbii]|uniref:nuclear body protein SP140-like n=1 Tax=Elgaria multicarinata webbii TaxID=159646 RepID=UPI002FCD128C